MAQAVSRQTFTAEAWVRSQASPTHGLCGGKRGIWTAYVSSTSVFASQGHSINVVTCCCDHKDGTYPKQFSLGRAATRRPMELSLCTEHTLQFSVQLLFLADIFHFNKHSATAPVQFNVSTDLSTNRQPLTTCSTVVFQKLMVSQLVDKSPTI
jgi:hypothetical protein